MGNPSSSRALHVAVIPKAGSYDHPTKKEKVVLFKFEKRYNDLVLLDEAR